MNGKFELDVTHKLDNDIKKDVGLLAYNPIVTNLTELCLKYDKKPEDVVALFKKIRKALLE